MYFDEFTVLTIDTDTFALANLFQVLESNMGIIGACLPVMRQTLKRHCGVIFGTLRSTKSEGQYYYDDSFAERYVMQNMSNKQKPSAESSWHNVSVSGPDFLRSSPRKSDELGIITEAREIGDRDSGAEDSGSSRSRLGNGIRKEFAVSVDRSQA